MPPTPPKKPAPPVAPEVELEDVVMEGDGKGGFRVSVRKVRGVVIEERVLEEKVSLPVARQTATLWRAKNGGLHRGLR